MKPQIAPEKSADEKSGEQKLLQVDYERKVSVWIRPGPDPAVGKIYTFAWTGRPWLTRRLINRKLGYNGSAYAST